MKTITKLGFISLVILITSIWLQVYFWINKDIIAWTTTVIFAIVGYFVTHYLEIERKRHDLKMQFYHELILWLRVITKDWKEKMQYLPDFEKALFSSWIYASSKVKIALNNYIDSYIKLNVDREKFQSSFIHDENILMKAIRNECLQDKEIDYKAIYLKE
ncbi:MAG: hypothetical protein ACD_78C00107G0003 [uncultured bacterium (gcode 4)]|uniref:Uncharacterized protein n=1 Tax=uncultured bacterium (gcode 4) TaxID=1234023 RepID=K1XYM4_9BACT|nr:MAG: hypothetical protein ACD_78C00107G0003 [uncultured bacterium (gcode 4)]